ncbi:DUF4139 domain-containing protein [Rhodobacter sp. 24-YEA-8]|uniref:DUF4139 domain-containing protein n=1 Tax=Rhodobacter sp. 24-YEA-8 TaxID=1884310 RepID=UPI00089CB247|nr:DUF4139 domain-containing protein [Rhodobacter sp. 24-YEA-8]SEC18054.1 conserved hypothetical protein [Rhodobacter sp. 24-YEA-8]
MRALLAALLATTAFPAFADTITAGSQIISVTVYPQGAKITREVTFESPSAGAHELLITDLPAGTEPGLMQLAAAEGISTGAFSLRSDRLPPRDEALTPDQEAAKATVEAAEAALRAATSVVDAGNARIQAATARAGYLASISGQPPEGATAETLREFAKVIGEETLAAAEEASAARADLWPAQKALEEAQKALADAEASFAALPSRAQDYTVLSVGFESAGAGTRTITLSHYVDAASWRPFYDLRLTRKDGGGLTIDRSVLVSQETGEDWSGVDLTLSSSRPSEQSAPSTLWPWQRWIEKEQPPALERARNMGAAEMDMVIAPALAAEPAPISASAAMEGDTVVYHYPRKVDIADGVEDLRLSLDPLQAEPGIFALAVPSRDQSAFVMAKFTNSSGEPLLPGEALLYREGVLVGSTSLGLIPAGKETEIAFGALDSITLSRDMPQRDSGQTGVFSTSNQLSETAILRIENLGSESWPVKVIDQVPYSEQQDLSVKTTISPQPTVTDVEGQRGIMAWEFDLEAGAKQEISLGYTMSWPDGMVLR